MRYPEIGDRVRVKNETGLHAVTEHWKPGRVKLDDGRIFWLDGIITPYQKYVTLYVIQVHYGSKYYGWEDVTQEEIRSEGIQRRKEYRDNQNYPVRMIKRKVPNELWKGDQ